MQELPETPTPPPETPPARPPPPLLFPTPSKTFKDDLKDIPEIPKGKEILEQFCHIFKSPKKQGFLPWPLKRFPLEN